MTVPTTEAVAVLGEHPSRLRPTFFVDQVSVTAAVMPTSNESNIYEFYPISAQWTSQTDPKMLDAEMARRQNTMIVPLQRRRNSLQPISRLADEVMRAIFDIAVSNWEGWDETTVSPFLLSHVCFAWRGIALTHGRLWWNVDVSLPCLQVAALIERSAPYTFDILLDVVDFVERDDGRTKNELNSTLARAIQHAHRISKFVLNIGTDYATFEQHIWPTLGYNAPVFSELARFDFQADLPDADDTTPTFSLAPLFMAGAPKLQNLHLSSCSVGPSQLKAFPLHTLYMPESSPANGKPNEWRAALSFLAPTLTYLYLAAEVLRDIGHLPVELGLVSDLTLRGSVTAIREALSGLILPAVNNFQLDVNGWFNDHVSNIERAQFFGGVVSTMLHDKKDSTFELAFTTNASIKLTALDDGTRFTLISDNKRQDLLDFSSALSEQMRSRIVQLKVSRKTSVQRDDNWNNCPFFNGLDTHLPQVRALYIDFYAAFVPILEAWTKGEERTTFPNVQELHLSGIDFRWANDNPVTSMLLRAMAVRNASGSDAQPIGLLAFNLAEKLYKISSLVRNSLGEEIKVRINGTIIPVGDAEDPEGWWGRDGDLDHNAVVQDWRRRGVYWQLVNQL
jgi:hypothetical protein